MKRSILLLLMLIVLLSAIPANADGGIMVTIDGEYLTFDGDQGFPIIIEGRTLVPLRAVFEALGTTVEYTSATKEIKATKGEQIIYLTVDFQWAIVYKNELSSTNVKLDVPPAILGGRTYVPLRFVSEALGCTVKYEDTGATQYITITTPNGSGVQNNNGTITTQKKSLLSAYKNETINGEYVDFNSYDVVVAEDYYGENYQDLVEMDKEIYYNEAYADNDYMYEIAFFGEVYGVTVNTYQYIGALPVAKSIGYLHNKILLVHSSFPNDGAVDIITFTDSSGRSHQIVVEDMSDDKDIILIETK